MSRTLKAILFDFNGVIVNDEPLHLELIQQVLQEEGIFISAETCRALCLGVPDHAGFRAVLATQPTMLDAEAQLQRLLTRKAAAYLQAIRERDLLFPGIAELIPRLAARWPLALVSGALRQEIDFSLTRSSLREHFRAVIAAEDVTHGKPDPAGFLLGLQRLGTSPLPAPQECLVIEDSLAGITAAKRAGMFCIAVTTSFPAAALQAADVVLPDLQDFDPVQWFARTA